MRKVCIGQRLCNCANNIIQFWRLHTDSGRYGKEMLNLCVRVLNNAYVVVKNELWPSILWKKLAMVKDCNCANNKIGGYTQTGNLWKSDVKFLWKSFAMPMLWQNMNTGQVCCG